MRGLINSFLFVDNGSAFRETASYIRHERGGSHVGTHFYQDRRGNYRAG